MQDITHRKEALMFEVSEKAREMLKEIAKERKISSIRIQMFEGG
jgi:uncharacterized radical SAM superfamily Fe-S cluster-containing enzyme